MDPIEIMARASCASLGMDPDFRVGGKLASPTWKTAAGEMQAALAALEVAGFVVVPMQPTDAMRDAAMGDASSIFPAPYDRDHIWHVWRKMLAARPSVPSKNVQEPSE